MPTVRQVGCAVNIVALLSQTCLEQNGLEILGPDQIDNCPLESLLQIFAHHLFHLESIGNAYN